MQTATHDLEASTVPTLPNHKKVLKSCDFRTFLRLSTIVTVLFTFFPCLPMPAHNVRWRLTKVASSRRL